MVTRSGRSKYLGRAIQGNRLVDFIVVHIVCLCGAKRGFAKVHRRRSPYLGGEALGFLLVPQAIDGVEVGRQACGIIAEEQAHTNGDDETN